MTSTLVNPTTGFEGLLANDDNMPFILMAMEAADDIAVDTETSGLNVRNKVDYLMGICVDVPGVSSYIPIRHIDSNINKTRWLPHLVPILQKKPLIWHNLKFDYHSFKTLGVDPLEFKGPQFDTLLIATLIDEEIYSKELDYLAKRYLKLEKFESDIVHKMGEIYGYANIPASVYRNYGAWDARLTRYLRDFLLPRLRQQELESVYWETELPFNRDVLYRIEQRGVGVNSELAATKANIGRGRMATIERELGFSPASPIALGQVLLRDLQLPVLAHTKSCGLCATGQPVFNHEGPPSFAKAAMEEYDEILQTRNDTTALRISEYRGWQKATTALYEPLLSKVGPDGKVRTQFHQHRAVTGRLSSSDPNLQQIPRSTPKIWNGDAKRCFTSGYGDDWALYGWDYSQIELRLAAAYGSEELLLTEFAKPDADPFSALAPGIFGYLDPETRHRTKNQFVYPSLYGAGVRKIALASGQPLEAVRPLYENYQATIPGIISISNQVSELIRQRGFVKYWDGRRRHIRDRNKSYKGFNAVCQGGAAQLMKKAMLRCLEFEDPDNAVMVLTVHDEITWAVRREYIPTLEPLVVKAMTDWDFGVNLAVEGKEWK